MPRTLSTSATSTFGTDTPVSVALTVCVPLEPSAIAAGLTDTSTPKPLRSTPPTMVGSRMVKLVPVTVRPAAVPVTVTVSSEALPSSVGAMVKSVDPLCVPWAISMRCVPVTE